MIDTVFWTAQVAACVGGIILMGFGLSDEFRPLAQRVEWDDDAGHTA